MVAPVCTPEDIVNNRQLEAREFWIEVEHPEFGSKLTCPGAFFKSSEVTFEIARRAPLLGEHNIEIYGGELGISDKELVRLKQAGVI